MILSKFAFAVLMKSQSIMNDFRKFKFSLKKTVFSKRNTLRSYFQVASRANTFVEKGWFHPSYKCN